MLMTQRLIHSVDVAAPVAVAYRAWTQYSEFPMFMRHVENVRRLDERHLRWRVNLGGVEREFVTEIVEQIPDHWIAWRAVDGVGHSGVVTFHPLDAQRSRVLLQLELEPEGVLESLGALMGVPGFDVKRDMARFAEFVADRRDARVEWNATTPRRETPQRQQGAP
jgi:uncharacterized membrane protein